MDPKAMYQLTYGVYLLTARENGRDNGCIINTAVQVANNPNRVSIAVIKGNLTHDMVAATGICTLSALSTDAPFALFQRFGMQTGRNTDKFADFVDTARGENGLLHLTRWANGYLSLKVLSSMDLGSHTLFIGEVVEGEVLSQQPSCTYGYYQTTIKQTAPKPAAKKGWRCKVCGYVYEGEVLPEDYLCPLCKHGPEDFEYFDEGKQESGKAKFVCSVCGYVHEGSEPPAECPICKVPAEKFTKQAGEMTWAAEHQLGVAAGIPEELIRDLRANFEGECCEVGMYLAMARVAHREGYPEIGKYWEKAAWEEGEHAAKFAELLGEVVTDSTRKNLQLRVDAENGATAGKTDLAALAKSLGLDAVHDTTHEMGRDEARHGKALRGMLERYFK